MAKADTRRAVILDRLADHVLANGLAASSLRPLAHAAGVSDRMLLYYFSDKTEIIGGAIEVIATRLTVMLDARVNAVQTPMTALRPLLLEVILADDLWPFLRLWLEIASLAARGDPFYRAVGERIGRGFLAWGTGQLDSATPRDRTREAAQLLIAIEGALLLKSIGLDDVTGSAFAD